jgi:hypothetical protein
MPVPLVDAQSSRVKVWSGWEPEPVVERIQV